MKKTLKPVSSREVVMKYRAFPSKTTCVLVERKSGRIVASMLYKGKHRFSLPTLDSPAIRNERKPGMIAKTLKTRGGTVKTLKSRGGTKVLKGR